MKKIGIDKRDPSYRHFYYDDEVVLMSNPPKYKVTYVDDETDIDYVDCAYVIKIKDVIEDKIAETETNVEEVEVVEEIEEKPFEVIEEKKKEPKQKDKETPKKKGRKKKSEETVEEPKKTPLEQNIIINDWNFKYEYDVIDTEFSNIDELKNNLNNNGANGWELCGYEVYTNGYLGKKRIFCIIKRRVK